MNVSLCLPCGGNDSDVLLSRLSVLASLRTLAVFHRKTAEQCGRVAPQAVEVIQTTSPSGNS